VQWSSCARARVRIPAKRCSGLRAHEALVARDESVLRKVLSLLVDKSIATRDEILERLK
jgi:hypothetical protein